MARNASLGPFNAPCSTGGAGGGAKGLTGNSAELVSPVTKTAPTVFWAMLLPRSVLLPPRRAEETRIAVEAVVVLSLARNAFVPLGATPPEGTTGKSEEFVEPVT